MKFKAVSNILKASVNEPKVYISNQIYTDLRGKGIHFTLHFKTEWNLNWHSYITRLFLTHFGRLFQESSRVAPPLVTSELSLSEPVESAGSK